MKCRECENYKPIDSRKGACFGAVIKGDRDPKDSEKCQGRFFKPPKTNKKEL
ncbi:MAG: hypothetical protein M0R00_06070 [Candidatus Omnitrophica bacterium]|jgi:hypothetical protein|nr:hypothetical protein [Candidatus Omnitrophota bacterium]